MNVVHERLVGWFIFFCHNYNKGNFFQHAQISWIIICIGNHISSVNYTLKCKIQNTWKIEIEWNNNEGTRLTK